MTNPKTPDYLATRAHPPASFRHIVTTPSDPRLAARWPDDAANFEQTSGDDEPLYIVIGTRATADSIQRLAARLGLNVETLLIESRS